MKHLLRYMKGYRLQCVLAPAFKLSEALMELFVPLFVSRIIDVGIAQSDARLILADSLRIILLGIAGLLFSVTAQYFSAKAAIGFSTGLRSALFQKIQTFSYTRLDTVGLPTLITRLTGDVDRVQSGVNMTLRLFLRSPFLIIGTVAAAFLIDRDSALLFVATVPLLSALVFGVMTAGIRLFKEVQKKLDIITRSASDQLRGARVIRAFGGERAEIQTFSEENTALAALQKLSGKISALLTPGSYILINFATVLLIAVGALKVKDGALSAGQVVALYNYMAKILVELLKFADLIITVTRAAASASRIADLLNDGDGEDIRTRTPLPEDSGAPLIEFRDVSFTYARTEAPALEHIGFRAYPGQHIGIIGGTGSGKTTLVNLIPRFYEADGGQILYKGVDLRDLPVRSLREKIGVVPQKAALFHGSLRDNIRWGAPDATDEEILSALETAQARDVIDQKKDGLNFIIEENADNLSGGQRQRLTIARALVGKPEILILDDSSNALDYATDYRLRRALAALPFSPCIFTVSQRTAAVRDCDLILVLDDGKAVGVGTHDTLLASCDVYRQIHLSQAPNEREGGGTP